ncbi:efflux RND transporter periplasmic adaptor subunit [Subsaximicrobium wynnwilliamsii]|uniref:Efflux RND transporter periplasmic adaptor subunit n=1 Tax=Subsaximicrobium wynnwilliamsii TaxID=291179 RepID=A0A5C6ZL51_9FLAO|nr:efflux RND transporter periplasmic adaptor subunit [Subsaximicrobium wynnwilliamsii]TXD84436.1 efflux RND transporter periplasmic adaptor subunit [Subsaximicrobium wynnwilliamsii]TXD90117.1 efflux RND transporter periplasmic adaptor subunit [Subsaximicrobium wynnwilliamsii]TXE04169.1 efflux RND transporter periplasmic adaptor subunit [Subsaximicrobium wynnwilliamsii]
MKKYTYLLIVITASLFMASCGSEENNVAADKRPAVKVQVSEVSGSNTNPFLSVSGKIQSVNNADLSTRMMGFVKKAPFNVGDKVSKGQLLVSINNAELQAKSAQVNAGITEATVAFNNAQKDYKRFKNLFEDNSASQKELDDMTARYEMAKARLESAKQMKNEVNAQYAYTNITAPFSGVVTAKSVEEGDMANPGQALISIESPGNFEVMAMVPETEISQIKQGAEVDVLVKSINKTLKGNVSEISTSSKNTGGQYLVKIALDKTDVNILSGMFASVQFPVEKKAATEMVLIPTAAIINNGQLSGVYTVSESNTALLRWLRLGRTFDNQVEVLSGLSADETYIVSADGKLYNGVKIIPSPALPEGKGVNSETNYNN